MVRQGLIFSPPSAGHLGLMGQVHPEERCLLVVCPTGGVPSVLQGPVGSSSPRPFLPPRVTEQKQGWGQGAQEKLGAEPGGILRERAGKGGRET